MLDEGQAAVADDRSRRLRVGGGAGADDVWIGILREPARRVAVDPLHGRRDRRHNGRQSRVRRDRAVRAGLRPGWSNRKHLWPNARPMEPALSQRFWLWGYRPCFV